MSLRRYRLNVELVTDAETEVEAFVRLRRQLSSFEPGRNAMAMLGYVYPDGQIRPCAPLPAEYQLHIVESAYYGSHPERGYKDEDVFLAVPNDVVLPKLHLSHGSGGQWSSWAPQLGLLPPTVRIWDTEEDQWQPVLQLLGKQLEVPQGCTLHVAISRGKRGDQAVFLAVPPGVSIPELHLHHKDYRVGEWAAKLGQLPGDVMVWDYFHHGRWRPVDTLDRPQ